MIRIFFRVSMLFMFLLGQASFAGTGLLFNVTQSGNPGAVSITLCLNATGPYSCQNFTLSQLSLSIRTVVANHTYPNAGIKINTPGYTYANAGVNCTPMANGYCAFSVSDTSPHSINIVSTTTYTVGGTVSNLNVSGLVLQNNNGDNLAVPANATSFQFPTPVTAGAPYNVTVLTQPNGLSCSVSNGSGTSSSNVTNVAVNCIAHMAYMTNYGNNSISICPVNSNGTLGTCNAFSPSSAMFNNPAVIALNTTSSTPYALITNYGGNNVTKCALNKLDGSLSVCAPETPFTFANPTGITPNKDGSGYYISEFGSGIVTQCLIDQTGAFTTCASAGTGFTNPSGIRVNVGKSVAYVSNYSTGNVSTCTIGSGGSLSACSTLGGFSNPYGVDMNAAGNLAYVASSGGSPSIGLCPIASNNGQLQSCAFYTDASITGPTGVTLNKAGNVLYAANYGGGSGTTVVSLIVANDGTLSGPQIYSGTFNAPSSIAILE